MPSDTPITDEILRESVPLESIRSQFLAHLARSFERENASLKAVNADLLAALELPFKWDDAFNVSAASSDNLLDQHGWDGKQSPDEFMRDYARAAIARATA